MPTWARAKGTTVVRPDKSHSRSVRWLSAPEEHDYPAVRRDLSRGVPLQIADGYHRVCACYLTDKNSDLPTVLVDP